MFAVAITLTFGLNAAFSWGREPPLPDYVFFYADREAHPHFYVVNYVYQLYLFVVIAVGGVAVEGAFILLTLFIEARFVFVRRLVALLDERRYDDGAIGGSRDAPVASLSATASGARLRLINTLIDVHSDALGYVE